MSKLKQSLPFTTIKGNQKGIAHLLLMVLLAAGIVLGVYLVNQRTQLFPFAASNPVSPAPCSVSAPCPGVTGTISAKPEYCLFTSNQCSTIVSYTVNGADPSMVSVKSKETGEIIKGFRTSSTGVSSLRYTLTPVNQKTTFDLYHGTTLLASAKAEGETDPFTQKNITVTPTTINTTQKITLKADMLTSRDISTNWLLAVRDLSGKVITSRTVSNQQFSANQSKTIQIDLEIPVNTADGNYKVELKVVNSVNGLQYIRNESLADIVVKKTIFSATASTNPSTISPRGAISINSSATVSIDTNLRVLFEVVDSSGARKFSKGIESSFVANIPNNLATTWIIPHNMPKGVYTVRIYLQREIAPINYYINHNAASFTIN